MFEWLESALGSFGGEGFGTASTVNAVDDQEALGRSIMEQGIFDFSRRELELANEHAALGFEGAYEHATAGPAYDPTEADPYGFQNILGRAIVQQSQGHTADDTPLNMVGAADVGAWANAALGVASGIVSPPSGAPPISGAPRQIFSNRPGNGSGYVLGGTRGGSAPRGSMTGLLVLGLVAVGAYVALK